MIEERLAAAHGGVAAYHYSLFNISMIKNTNIIVNNHLKKASFIIFSDYRILMSFG
jgi:hypothetical protein